MWYALIAPKDHLVAEELLTAGLVVERPVYRVRSWNPRKSVAVVRLFPLVQGYLLLKHSSLPIGATRHSCHFYAGLSGEPLRVHDAEEFLVRVRRGDFDEDLTRGMRQFDIGEGTRVLVEMLGLEGVVTDRRRNQYKVELDGGRKVEVSRSVLSLA